jgi:hypothetical protein
VGDDVLGVVGVLILVDQDVREALLQLAQHVRMIAKRRGRSASSDRRSQGVVLLHEAAGISCKSA